MPLLSKAISNYTNVVYKINFRMKKFITPVIESNEMMVDAIYEVTEDIKKSGDLETAISNIIIPRIKKTPIWKNFNFDKIELLIKMTNEPSFKEQLKILPTKLSNRIQSGGSVFPMIDLSFKDYYTKNELVDIAKIN